MLLQKGKQFGIIAIRFNRMSSQELKDWSDEKERLGKLSLKDRRSHYFCNDNYIPLAEIPTWKSYYLENEKSLTEKISEKDVQRFKEDHGNVDQSHDLAEKVSIFRGDITKLEVDAIVNAANESLLGGGGVDGAIHRGAGKKLLDECRSLNGCQTGNAKITCGYKLPAKNIIHTVGPIGEDASLLSSCYSNSLGLMLSKKLRTIAFPCISTGVYGYPSAKAAPVAIREVRDALTKDPEKIDRVIFCLFLDKDVEIYERQLQLFFPVKS